MKQFSHEEFLATSSYKDVSEFQVTVAKLDELNKWKVGSLGKIYVNSKSNVKARLAARGFQENNQDIFCDSPACNKVSMRLILNIIACLK